MQTAYLKVMDGRAPFAGKSEFRTFLFGVIRRTATDERRRRAIRATLSLGILRGSAEPSAPDSVAASVELSEQSQRLRAALAQLSRIQRDTLHLVFYQEMTIAAAAEALGVPVGTARSHYERGKAEMRRLLGDD